MISNLFRGMWRLWQPIRLYWYRYPLQIVPALARFIFSFAEYKRAGGKLSFRWIAPVLSFRGEDSQSGGGHYFYQDIWALRKLMKHKPAVHYDIGSRLDGFVGQATSICPIVYIDLRPPAFQLPGFEFLQGDILHLPFEDNSVESLSCLHTIEHIGLGRYGDAINPEGYHLALMEIQRVMKPGGTLLLSMPVGQERVEFNAQRILNPLSCVRDLSLMTLIEFSVVDDKNEFLNSVNPEEFATCRYCCGLYAFEKR